MLFTFCYLYFLQGDILAEAQYVYSNGLTTYNLLVGSLIITVTLQVIQWIVALLSRLPSRWHALTYIPSMLLLAILTDVNKSVLQHFTFGAWLWVAPIILILYIILAIVAHRVDAHYNSASQPFKSQLYPNYIILFILILLVGGIPHTSDVYHYELKAERLILQGDYEAASQVGENSFRTSARLTQLRMYALSQQGQLAERLFDYPQHYGSQGLLDIADTLPLYRFSARHICAHLGAYCGRSIHSTQQYYQLMLSDSLWNQHTADYYLCSLLLDKKIKEFQRQLPRYYHLADSVPHAYDHLPRAYREALLILGDRDQALNGKVVIGHHTLATFSDQDLVQQYREYCQTKADIADPTQRINQTHRHFGHTYWWYYDYSHLAKGELEKK